MTPATMARTRRNWGVTLVEMMVAVTIVGVGILAFFGSFQYIMVSLHNSRIKSVATNLAQQQIEILKNKNYFMLQVTRSPQTLVTTSGSFLYDTTNYPPLTFSISGLPYTVYTYVSYVQMSGNVITGATSVAPMGHYVVDTGVKQIVSYVVWGSTAGVISNMLSISNLLENPSSKNLTTCLGGHVYTNSSGVPTPLFGAWVQTVENQNYFAVTDIDGFYGFDVAFGTYTLMVSSAGYFSASKPVTSPATCGATLSDFTLVPITSGTINGYAWFNYGPIISQIVGATTTVVNYGAAAGCPVLLPCGNASRQDVEYIELFNPATTQFNVYSALPSVAPVTSAIPTNEQLLFNSYNNETGILKSDIMAGGVYISTYIAPGGYFLIASAPKFMINGQWILADAYYNNSATPPNYISNYDWGAVQITDPIPTPPANRDIYDQVCWSGSSGAPSGNSAFCGFAPSDYGGYGALDSGYLLNTQYIPTPCGFNVGASPCSQTPWVGNQFVRFSSPTDNGNFVGVPPNTLDPFVQRLEYGSAYNSRINASDFAYPSVAHPRFVQNTLGTVPAGCTNNCTKINFFSPYTTNNSSLPPTPHPIISGTPPYIQYTSVPDGSEMVVSGVLEVSASTDTHSGMGHGSPASVTNFLGNPQPFAPFQITGVTTGTWDTALLYVDTLVHSGCSNTCGQAWPTPAICYCGTSSGGYWSGTPSGPSFFGNVHYATVSQGQTTSVPNPTTVPAATNPNFMLGPTNQDISQAFISGRVADVNDNSLSGVPVTTLGVTKTTGQDGNYLLIIPTPQQFIYPDVVINPNNVNPYYTSVDTITSILTGLPSSNYLTPTYLSQESILYGTVLSGNEPLPDVVVNVMSGSSQVMCGNLGPCQGTSNEGINPAAAVYYIRNLAAGDYTLVPVLQHGLISTPSQINVTALPYTGQLGLIFSGQFVGTMTVTDLYGTVAGPVTYNGSPVTSGALIIASTGTLSYPLPPINASTITAAVPLYSASTLADGTYSLQTMGDPTVGITYNLLITMPIINPNNGTVTVVHKIYAGVNGPTVFSGQITNFPLSLP